MLAAVTVDGSASSDADGSITRAFRWTWGDEVVVDAADVPASNIVGTRWTRVQDAGASGGKALRNPDRGDAKVATAAAVPASYVDVRFYAAAGVPYHLWFRMRAEGDSHLNDSMFRQFSGAVNSQGTVGSIESAAATPRSSSSKKATPPVCPAGVGTTMGACTLASPVYFATSGLRPSVCSNAKTDHVGPAGAELEHILDDAS